MPGLREAVQQGEVLFGCIDTWLIYKLTGKHLTEVSNIAASGFYDPFIMQSVAKLSEYQFTPFQGMLAGPSVSLTSPCP